jgi:hypothetical protein
MTDKDIWVKFALEVAKLSKPPRECIAFADELLKCMGGTKRFKEFERRSLAAGSPPDPAALETWVSFAIERARLGACAEECCEFAEKMRSHMLSTRFGLPE